MEDNNKCKCSYISYDDMVCRMTTDKNNPITKALLSCPIIQAELVRLGIIDFNDLDNLTSDDIYERIKKTRVEDWLDNQDVANMLHMSYRTLQNLRSEGILPYSRIKGKIYYRRQDIQQLMAENFINA